MLFLDVRLAAACSSRPILLGAALFSLWAGSSSAVEILPLSNADSGRQVKVSVGNQINVTLLTIGFGQYGTPSVSSSALRFLGVSSGPPNPGGPVQLYRFLATSAGRVQLSIPFTGGMGPNASTPPFTLTVQVN